MSLSEDQIEQSIQGKNLNAPRLNPTHIDSVIVQDLYWIVPHTTTTVCALVLKNGFVVIGESSSASPENFDEELGKQIANDRARAKIWPLEGYLLRQELFEESEEAGETEA